MNYTDTDGNPATGVVWSPGPLPGTVWVLPYAGASTSEAIVVHVTFMKNGRPGSQLSQWELDRRTAEAVSTLRKPTGYTLPVNQNRPEEVRAAHRQAFNDGRGLPAKDWYAALGYVPRDVVKGQAVQPDLFEAA